MPVTNTERVSRKAQNTSANQTVKLVTFCTRLLARIRWNARIARCYAARPPPRKPRHPSSGVRPTGSGAPPAQGRGPVGGRDRYASKELSDDPEACFPAGPRPAGPRRLRSARVALRTGPGGDHREFRLRAVSGNDGDLHRGA